MKRILSEEKYKSVRVFLVKDKFSTSKKMGNYCIIYHNFLAWKCLYVIKNIFGKKAPGLIFIHIDDFFSHAVARRIS